MNKNRSADEIAALPEEERVAAGTTKVEHTRTPFTQQMGRIAMVIVVALFTIFALFNAQYVDFDWIFGETVVQRAAQGNDLVRVSGGIRLIVLLVASFALGALSASLFSLRRRIAKRPAKQPKASKRSAD